MNNVSPIVTYIIILILASIYLLLQFQSSVTSLLQFQLVCMGAIAFLPAVTFSVV